MRTPSILWGSSAALLIAVACASGCDDGSGTHSVTGAVARFAVK
jgi:hypothetical protein